MTTRKVISNKSNKVVELINNDIDSNMWIVKVSKKNLFFKKLLYSKWFNKESDALNYAESIS